MGVTRTDLTMVLNETLGNATEMMSGEGEGWGLQALTIFAWVIVALFIIINLAAIVFCLWVRASKHQLYKALWLL